MGILLRIDPQNLEGGRLKANWGQSGAVSLRRNWVGLKAECPHFE